MTLRTHLSRFLHSKAGKLIPILLIALLVGTASSTVYVFYIANTSATVQTPKVLLRAGTDSSGSACAAPWPCAYVNVAATGDYEAITMSLFPSVSETVQPQTYYSNLTTIQNHDTVLHTLRSIELYNIVIPSTTLGGITVYYCTTQTEFNPDGSLVTAGDCPDSFTIVQATTGTHVIVSSVTLAAGAKDYIEVAAWAASTATVGNSVTFDLAFQWI